MRPSPRSAVRSRQRLAAHALAVACGAGSVALLLWLTGPEHERPNLDLLIVPVLGVAYLRGLGPALTATVTVAIGSDYWLLDPVRQLAIHETGDRYEWGALVVSSALAAVLVDRLQRAQRQARERERVQSVTLASIGDGIIATDGEGHIRFLNAEALRIVGTGADLVIGKSLGAVLPWLEGAARRVLDDSIIEPGGASPTSLGATVEREGQTLTVEATVAPIVSDDGSVEGAVVALRDRTERVRAEATTRQWADAFRNCGHGIGLGDTASGRISACNPAYAALTGREPTELIGSPILALYDPAMHDRMRAAIAEADRSGRATFDTRMCHRDGSLVAVHVDLVSVKEASGEVRYRVATVQDLRERQQAQAQMQLQARLLELAFDPQIVWELGGAITFWNEGAAALYGFSAAEAAGRALHDLLDTWEEGGRDSRLDELARTGIWSGLLVHRARDGRLIEVESRQQVVIDASGRKLVLESNRDMTRHRRIERQLRESEGRLKLFIEHAPAAIAMFDHAMRYLAASKRWLTDYRLPIADLLGRSHYDVFPEIGEAWKDVHRRGLGGEVIVAEADRFERADGTVQWLRWEVHPWYQVDGEIGGIIIFTEDITARTEAQLALAESEQRLQAIIENLNEATVISGLRGWLVHWNRASLELFGFRSNEELMASFSRLPELVQYVSAEGDVLPMSRWPLARLLAGEEVRDLELTVRRVGAGIERRVIVNGRRMRAANGGELAFVSLHDVTERVRAEAALRERTEDLERSNQDLEQFAYVASHDLKEPLRAVAGCVSLLERRYRGQLDARADELIQHAVDGATRMQQLIDDLLQFSRIGTRGGDFRRIALESALADAERNLAVSIHERGATITHDPLPSVDADSAQITSLLQNLLGNALKFCAATPRIHVSARQADGEWVVAVADNGIGIDPQYHERIFGVFQRLHTRTEYPGTGIGLALCKKIVERHGGRIWVESAVGAGSRFHFSLPARDRAAAAPPR